MGIYNGFDQYWQLERHYGVKRSVLHEKVIGLGYKKVTSSRTAEELVELLHRHERGQVCYDRYTDQQLLHASQGTEWAIKAKADGTIPYTKRIRLINGLQKADTIGSSFTRFVDLPPELRIKVYQ